MDMLEQPTVESKPVDQRVQSRTFIARDTVAKDLACRAKQPWSTCDPQLRNHYRREANDLLMLFAVDLQDDDLQARLRAIR